MRPKMMTVTAIMAGLLPIMWRHGTGSEVMRRIAAPHDRRHGHLHRADPVVLPVIHYFWKDYALRRPPTPAPGDDAT